MDQSQPVSLRDLAVLVTLSMSAYSPRSMDKKTSKELTQKHGAKEGSARVIINRLSGTQAGDALDKITKAQGEARTLYYSRTLPWDDNGRRMASNDAAHDLFIELKGHENKIAAHVAEFCRHWPTAAAEAKIALNGMWDANDYTATADQMRARFKIQIELEPMPRASDLRMDAPDAVMAEIIQSTERTITERFHAGCREAHARLYHAIEAIHAKLSDPEAIFRDSLVGNLRELVDMLPALNIAKDPELTRISADAKKRLLSFDLPPQLIAVQGEPSTAQLADKLRHDMAHRRETASAARAILNDMRAFMGGTPD